MSSRVPGMRPEDDLPRITPLQRISDRVSTITTLGEDDFDEQAVMSDLRLTDAIRDVLRPLLAEGFEMVDREVVSKIDFVRRLVTVIRFGDTTFYLANLPAKVLRAELPRYRAVLSMLHFAFPRDARVVVLSHRVDAIPLIARQIFQASSWAQIGFVGWLDICASGSDGGSPVGQLLVALGLEPAEQADVLPMRSLSAVPPRSPDVATDVEIDLIRQNLAQVLVSQLDPGSAFNDFVDRLQLPAGQSDRAKAFRNADVSTMAKGIVTWMRAKGREPLGRMVLQLVNDEPGRPDAEVLLDIAHRCGVGVGEDIGSIRTRAARR